MTWLDLLVVVGACAVVALVFALPTRPGKLVATTLLIVVGTVASAVLGVSYVDAGAFALFGKEGLAWAVGVALLALFLGGTLYAILLLQRRIDRLEAMVGRLRKDLEERASARLLEDRVDTGPATLAVPEPGDSTAIMVAKDALAARS